MLQESNIAFLHPAHLLRLERTLFVCQPSPAIDALLRQTAVHVCLDELHAVADRVMLVFASQPYLNQSNASV